MLSKALLSLGIGCAVYKYMHRKIDLNQYFISGYRFKFVKGITSDLNEEELQTYSDKFASYGNFVKKHSDIPVVISKHRVHHDFETIWGQAIAIPSVALMPPSVVETFPKPYQKYVISSQENAEAILMHELGHVAHDHSEKRIQMGAMMISIQWLCPFGKWKYLVPICIVTDLLLLYMIRKQEYEADMYAVNHGYGPDLIKYFEQCIDLNKKTNSIFITASGEDLRDLLHPLLSDRIGRIQQLIHL